MVNIIVDSELLIPSCHLVLRAFLMHMVISNLSIKTLFQ